MVATHADDILKAILDWPRTEFTTSEATARLASYWRHERYKGDPHKATFTALEKLASRGHIAKKTRRGGHGRRTTYWRLRR